MRYVFLLACGLCISFLARAEDAEIAQLFRSAGVDGTIVIESVKTGRKFTHNEPRSRQPYIAASTFKILHTLIALEEGAISGPDASFALNLATRDVKDLPLRVRIAKEALRVKNVM